MHEADAEKRLWAKFKWRWQTEYAPFENHEAWAAEMQRVSDQFCAAAVSLTYPALSVPFAFATCSSVG
jgi:hypothetical protein